MVVTLVPKFIVNACQEDQGNTVLINHFTDGDI